MLPNVRRLIVTFAVVLVVAPAFARANEVDDRGAAVAKLEQRVGQLGAERRGLAQTYEARVAAIAELKAQPSAWGRDRKLQGLLAESRDMAGALDKKDGELRAATERLATERVALLTAIDAELRTSPEPDAARRA